MRLEIQTRSLSLKSKTIQHVANRVRIEFHDVGEGEVHWRSAFQVRSAYRNESDFRIECVASA